MTIPPIAKDYWRLPRTRRKGRSVFRSFRRTSHRFVNHGLGNLDPNDVDPFAIREPNIMSRAGLSSMLHRLPYESSTPVSLTLSDHSNRFTRERAVSPRPDADGTPTPSYAEAVKAKVAPPGSSLLPALPRPRHSEVWLMSFPHVLYRPATRPSLRSCSCQNSPLCRKVDGEG
jgi:hypothetical protein